MATSSEFTMQPADVIDAAGQLEALADRIDKVMEAEAPNLTVVASGRDEVSQRVASTLNDVHTNFVASTGAGSNEAREIAATLRAHTQNVMEAEQDFAV
jgi:phage-related protein